jgi:hypothetical protein
MTLALFGTILLLVLIAFCWGHSRTIAAAVIAVLLGMTIASASPATADMAQNVVTGLSSGLAYLAGSAR